MAGEILSAFELCGKVSGIGLRVYGIAVAVSTNCEKQVTGLQTKVYDLSKVVIQIGETLEKDKTHQLKDLDEVLEDISMEFNEIDEFVTKLQEHDDGVWLGKVAKRTKKLRSVLRKIEDFHCTLENLNERLLNKNLPAAILDVVLCHAQRQQEEYDNMVRENATLRERERMNSELLKKNSDDFVIDPSDLSDEKDFLKTINSKYSRAKLDGQKVVVKRCHQANNPLHEGRFAREARNLKKFSKGSIVRVFGMWDGQDDKFLVLEDMEKGTLSKVLEEAKELSLKNKFELAMTAAQSLKRMHLKLVHTALRTEKFLVNSDYTAKLSGMGYAVTFSSCKRYVSSSDSDNIYFYRAPERFRPCKPTKNADIYGFGIILWEIFTQTKPFSSKLQGEDLNEENVRKFIKEKNEEYELNLQDPVNDDLSELVRRCRSFDPKDRPDISVIVKDLTKIRATFLAREDPAENENVGL